MLANEAAYLYVLSKSLHKINKKLHHSARKVEKHKRKYEQAKEERKRHKHRIKHAKASEKVTDLLKEHNKIMTKMRYHLRTFILELHKEQRLK
ncbi:MAG: hypothetical protein AB1668_05065 [Nanoarchaeota archaeon]